MPRLVQFSDEMPGIPLQDLWDDITPATGSQDLGYPTQKPEALLERIIRTSSNDGDIVLDPFCGCGTAIAVAERLHRRWIGIDITHLAISLMVNRLHDAFGEELEPYEVIGSPRDLASAESLARRDPFQFEWWAIGLIEARPARDKKKGADAGIDGYINFFDDDSGKPKTIVVQVKSGHVNRGQIATLKSDMDRENAQIGVFVTLQEPTEPMRQEALRAGFYTSEITGRQYPKVQIRTIKELLDGKGIDYPSTAAVTFAKAERKYKAEQKPLL